MQSKARKEKKQFSTASNLPRKEMGKYIKILGEALKLSQPINSNSMSVHMRRFCTLLQLNKSAQELAAHIGEVVINKCFCTRRIPISIAAAAIYLLEDKRKTQAEICKVTGLTEVTLHKVYKEILENWDDLLPPNYTPAVPPEKAFPMTLIASGRSSISKPDGLDGSHLNLHQDKDKIPEIKGQNEALDVMDIDHQVSSSHHDRSLASLYTRDLNSAAFWQPQFQFGVSSTKQVEKEQKSDDAKSMLSDCEHRVNIDTKISSSSSSRWMGQTPSVSPSQRYPNPWQFTPGILNMRLGKAQFASDSLSEHQIAGNNPGGATDG